jgi:hypothetical protein
MCVLGVELLCQAVTGWILALDCQLLGAHGCLWLHFVLSSIKWPCFWDPWPLGHLPGAINP